MTTSGKPVVVIVGASFSGITALSYLIPFVRVVLVDPKDYFEYSPGVPVCFTGSRIDQIVSPLSQFYENSGSFVNGFFRSVSLEKKTILVVSSSQGEMTTIHYDALLLCCGLPYPSPIRSMASSLAQRKQELVASSMALKKTKVIAILGGGLVGVELAAELCSSREVSCSPEPPKSIIVFTSDERLLPTLPISAGNKAQKWLAKNGVQIHFGSKISSITTSTADPASLDCLYHLETLSGKVYTVDSVINCTGNLSLLPSTDQRQNLGEAQSEPNALDADFLSFSSLKTSRGTIAVDSSLKVLLLSRPD
jgi:NADH dehydrogenase FAD-containing subunit